MKNPSPSELEGLDPFSAVEVLESLSASASVLKIDPVVRIPKQVIRTSLKASTFDGIFATIFSSTTGGVLLINFLLQLGATPVEIGSLSSIPLLTNFLQPLGAYFGDRLSSRNKYILFNFGLSRLLWLILVGGIAWFCYFDTEPHQLVIWTLAIILITHILEALASPAWLSWMAVLVPSPLRGRYFSFRSSTASLTNFLSVPLLGFAVSAWPGGVIQGYGVVLVLGIVNGLISLACQFWMVDVNPQISRLERVLPLKEENVDCYPLKEFSIFKDLNFLKYLLYLGLWTFAINLSTPFFNLYLLNDLELDLGTVTIYTSLIFGANLAMLILWGKLADRVGNRPLLILVGVVMALTPLFWLVVGTDSLSVWVWLPLIHIALGGFGAAIDLCNINIQMKVAPLEHSSQYFAFAAAVTGISGGLAAMVGGFLAQLDLIGGLLGLFAISAVLRLIALLPLIFVRELHSKSIADLAGKILPFKPKPLSVVA